MAEPGGVLVDGAVRQQHEHADQREDTDHGDGPEGGAPAELLAEQGAQRDAEHVGRGEPTEHEGDRSGLLRPLDEGRGDDRPDPEEGAVGEGGEDPPQQEQLVAGGERGDEVAGDEQDHEPGQDVLAVQAVHERGEAQGADGHGERVAGDEHAGGGLADLEVLGDLGQQAGDDEFGEADPEASEGEGEQCEGHRDPFVVAGRRAMWRAASGGDSTSRTPSCRACNYVMTRGQ